MLYVQSIQPNFNLQCNFDSLFLDKQYPKRVSPIETYLIEGRISFIIHISVI